ncbi:MAG: aspartate/glutamate racemase family protein [Marinibacterium profundimaris]
MRKIGIVGGVGWASTIDYYRAIAEGAGRFYAARGHVAPYPMPPMAIESVVQSQTRALCGRPGDDRSWEAFDAVFRTALINLDRVGCAFAIIASNTPHARLASIRKGVHLDVLSILDVTATATADAGAERALVLGTSVTMEARDYALALERECVAANTRLPDADIAEMQAMIDTDFYGGASGQARDKLMGFIRRHAPPGTAVVLACTELPLAFPDHLDDPVFKADGYVFINSSAAHVAAALDRALTPSGR